MGTAQALDDPVLEPRLHTAFRAAAARANYLSQDRPDVQFAAKEICRWMSKPTASSWEALKRLCRYLCGLPRLVFRYDTQESEGLTVYSDTDWGGCAKTRKSTSGGCIFMGTHLLKSWSSTQQTVSLSSGEAEYYGAVRAAGAGLGMQALMDDLGLKLPVLVFVDSSAAIGIASRQGLGKLRHLDTHTLWLQQAVRSKKVTVRKIDGCDNPADLFTKHLASRDRLRHLMDLFACDYRDGRSKAAPMLRRTERMGVEMRDEAELGQIRAQERLPHYLSEDRLDMDYPKVYAPADLETTEFEMNGEDVIVNCGLRIADKIMEAAGRQGLLRHLNIETETRCI